MKVVIGVDGCPAGWIAVIWGRTVRHQVCETFTSVLDLEGDIIAVDMPIGFPAVSRAGGRDCEREARKCLAPGRKSSIFASPSRAVIDACPASYRAAAALNRESSDPPRSLTRQAFGIVPKMAEIDRLMAAGLQQRVFETHPEVAFSVMNNGTSISASKKSPHGRSAREQLLKASAFPYEHLPPNPYRLSDVGLDDIVDACACAWVARRILDGSHRHFPADPPRDARGLRMEINA